MALVRRPRLAAIALTALIILALAGHVFLAARTFRAEPSQFAEPRGYGALPVTVYDATGLVAEVRIWIRPGNGGTDSPLLGTELLPDGWVRFGWLGGACVDGTTLVFAEGGPGYRMAWREEGLVLACMAIGIHRAIDVRFLRLIEPDEVELVGG
jgi:hypothetical protein